MSTTPTYTEINDRGVQIFEGAGSPEGVVTANPGALYIRTDGSGATLSYRKDTGTGNTGWATFGSGGGGGGITGSGTTNKVAKFTGATAVGDSSVTDTGTAVTIDPTTSIALDAPTINIGTTSATPLNINLGSSSASANPTEVFIQGVSHTGTNQAGRQLTIAPGAGTGNSTPVGVVILSADVTGSGSNVQLLQERLTVGGNGVINMTVEELQIDGVAQAPGASTATMTNSPVAGNPAGWLKITIDGLDAIIPYWAA